VGWRIPGASQWKPDLTAAAATLEEHGVERAQLCRLVDGDLDNLARGREGRRDVGGGRGLGTRWPLGLPLFFHRTVEKKKMTWLNTLSLLMRVSILRDLHGNQI
jgi:hypothetical protein